MAGSINQLFQCRKISKWNTKSADTTSKRSSNLKRSRDRQGAVDIR